MDVYVYSSLPKGFLLTIPLLHQVNFTKDTS